MTSSVSGTAVNEPCDPLSGKAPRSISRMEKN